MSNATASCSFLSSTSSSFSFFFYFPSRFENYISERARIFIGLLYIFFYRVTFRTRVFLRRKEIDIWEDFFRRKSRSLISNISIRNGIVITEFFLITDNLSIYVRWKIKSQKILKILEFESISDGATINSIEFEIFLFFI